MPDSVVISILDEKKTRSITCNVMAVAMEFTSILTLTWRQQKAMHYQYIIKYHIQCVQYLKIEKHIYFSGVFNVILVAMMYGLYPCTWYWKLKYVKESGIGNRDKTVEIWK
eukprot:126451_1